MKRILCLLTIATLCVAGRSYVMADEIDDKNLLNGGTSLAQSVVAEYEYGYNFNLTHDYVWKDDMKVATYAAASESEQLSYASWQEHKEADGTLKHRAAKISPNSGSSAWYACSQTKYKAAHFSRCRIIKTITGKILEDSNQVQVQTGTATARTAKERLYALDWDFSMRSFWGIL